MKKIIIACCLIAVAATCAYSQLRIGIRGGVSTSSLSPSDFNFLNENGFDEFKVALENANFGVHAGLVFQAKIGKNFLIQPEVLLNSNKVSYEITDLDDPELPSEVLDEKYQYLDIPLLFGFKFGPLRLQAGPVGHVYLDSSSDLLTDPDLNGYEQDFNELTLGWQGGIGLDLWNLMLDFRYEGNFSNFGDHFVFKGRSYEFDETPSRFIFSAALLFGGGK